MEMADFEVTRMGERGQIVIPLLFRNRMKLDKGEKFIVIEQGDNLLFRRMKTPSKEEINELLKKTREHAQRHGLTERHVEDAIRKARKK